MKKRITALLLAALIFTGLTGCSFNITDTKSTTDDVSAYTPGQITQETTEEYTTSYVETTSEITTSEVTTTEITTTQITTSEVTVTTEVTTEPDSSYENQVHEGATPILYKVTDGKGNYIWLFGSIHVGRPDYYPLPDYVNRAFDESKALAVEMDIAAFEKKPLIQMIAVKRFTYKDGTTIKDHIPEETYNKAVEILKENGSYSEALDSLKPVLWSNFIDGFALSKLDADSSLGVDLHLLNRAKESGKTIYEVESALQQYNMLSSFSDDLQALLLISSVSSYGKPEKTKNDLDIMMDLWAEGNEAEFSEYLSKESNVEDERIAKLYEEYNQKLITDRNKDMTDYVKKALKKGKVIFICVGSAHVVGKDAIADRLRAEGYTVEQITA